MTTLANLLTKPFLRFIRIFPRLNCWYCNSLDASWCGSWYSGLFIQWRSLKICGVYFKVIPFGLYIIAKQNTACLFYCTRRCYWQHRLSMGFQKTRTICIKRSARLAERRFVLLGQHIPRRFCIGKLTRHMAKFKDGGPSRATGSDSGKFGCDIKVSY